MEDEDDEEEDNNNYSQRISWVIPRPSTINCNYRCRWHDCNQELINQILLREHLNNHFCQLITNTSIGM